jgi:hypothetical protein
MSKSLHHTVPLNASQIELEWWARDLRRQWFRRMYRSLVERLAQRIGASRFVRPSIIAPPRRHS